MPGQPTAEDIINKYKGGQSMRAIAKFSGISAKDVRRVLVDADMTIRNTPRANQERVAKVFAEHGDEIIRSYEEGESSTSLARRFGMATNTLNGFIDVRGVRRRTNLEALRLMHLQRQAAGTPS